MTLTAACLFLDPDSVVGPLRDMSSTFECPCEEVNHDRLPDMAPYGQRVYMEEPCHSAYFDFIVPEHAAHNIIPVASTDYHGYAGSGLIDYLISLALKSTGSNRP